MRKKCKPILTISDELVQRIYKYFDEVNEEPVIYHWKYKLEEIDPNEKVVVDTLPVKKSS